MHERLIEYKLSLFKKLMMKPLTAHREKHITRRVKRLSKSVIENFYICFEVEHILITGWKIGMKPLRYFLNKT